MHTYVLRQMKKKIYRDRLTVAVYGDFCWVPRKSRVQILYKPSRKHEWWLYELTEERYNLMNILSFFELLISYQRFNETTHILM